MKTLLLKSNIFFLYFVYNKNIKKKFNFIKTPNIGQILYSILYLDFSHKNDLLLRKLDRILSYELNLDNYRKYFTIFSKVNVFFLTIEF